MKDYAIYTLDTDGRVASWNAGAEQLQGYRADEIVGRSYGAFFTSHARAAGVPERLLREAGERGYVEAEAWQVRKDRGLFRADLAITAVRTGAGAPTGFAMTLRDRSEAERMEERAGRVGAERRAREAVEHARELAEDHAREEAALRAAARTLAEANEVAEVLEMVAALAMDVADADGAYVERADRAGRQVEVVAVAGWGHPDVGTRVPFSGSLAEVVLKGGHTQVVTSVPGMPRPMSQRLRETCGECSALAAPLRAADHGRGALVLLRRADRLPFTDDEPERVMSVADMAALALRRLDAVEQAERHAREERALLKAAAAVAAAGTVEGMLAQIARSALEALDADGAVVERLDAATGRLQIVAAAGDARLRRGTTVPFAGSLAERARRGKAPVVLDRFREERAPAHWQESCSDCCALALWIGEGEAGPGSDACGVGALVLLRAPGSPPFGSDEAERGRTFGHLAALACRQAQLREESEERRRQLEQVTESRVGLLRGFSHDVKNPLGAALGFVELLQQGLAGGGAPAPKEAEALERIHGAVSSALKLIEELVELARAEAGQLEVNPEDVKVCAVAREVVEQYTATAERKGLRLTLDLPTELPPLRTDPMRLRQVVGNLVSNAVKYTPEHGTIAVRAELTAAGPAGATAGGPWLALRVKDTGPGIPRAQQERVFAEFTRLDPEAAEGAGLGLAISRRIARRLGGEITLVSEPGRGSEFTFWLPGAREQPKAAAA